MKRITRLAALIAMMSILVCGGVAVTSASAAANNGAVVITPYASEYISGWSPLLSKTSYGASVSFTGTYSGSVTIKLQNSSGSTIDSFTESFSSKSNIAYVTARTTSSGTYRIEISVTISGTTTTRTSSYMNI